MSKRVVITGLGILAGNGKGRADYFDALQNGRVGYRPVTLFDASGFYVNQAGEISDFDPKIYMGPKGLRSLDRSTTLLVSAARLALDDCGLIITDENTDDCGVSVGTTLGSIKSISDFDEVTLREGPRYTNPALFPNTVINSPASQVSIWHKIKGFNTTISSGFTASMDAMQYAYDFIQWDRARAILAGGVEEMCYQTFFGFHELRFLSGSKPGEEFVNCPFDVRRNGVTLGEGACLMCLEDEEHARARGANILAEILGFGYSFDPYRINKYNPRASGLKAALADALNQTGLGPSDIDVIMANANSTRAADKIEAYAIREVFGSAADKIPVTAVKSMVGETYSVSGAMAVAAGLAVLQDDLVPPTVNCLEPDPDCALNIVRGKSAAVKAKNIMVINFGPNGSNTIMILRRREGK